MSKRVNPSGTGYVVSVPETVVVIGKVFLLCPETIYAFNEKQFTSQLQTPPYRLSEAPLGAISSFQANAECKTLEALQGHAESLYGGLLKFLLQDFETATPDRETPA